MNVLKILNMLFCPPLIAMHTAFDVIICFLKYHCLRRTSFGNRAMHNYQMHIVTMFGLGLRLK